MPEPTPSEDPATRALEASLAGARQRRDGDATDPGIPVAATVILARDAEEGPQVLLIERPDRGSFAGAWVFPGGKLEAGDREGPEEAEEEVARRAGARETWEETSLDVDPSEFVSLSVWDPPPGIALRIRTWFFVAPAPDGAISLAPDEALTAEWSTPADALARHGRGELTLYPPTWVTLHELAEHADVRSILDTARLAGVQHFETVARRGGEGPMLLWQGDADYLDDTAGEASGARHRLEIGALPWRYTRGG